MPTHVNVAYETAARHAEQQSVDAESQARRDAAADSEAAHASRKPAAKETEK